MSGDRREAYTVNDQTENGPEIDGIGGIEMKLDQNTLKRLLEMSDERLWASLKMLTSVAGIELSDRLKRPDKLQRLRRVLAALTEEDLRRVSELAGVYQQKGR